MKSYTDVFRTTLTRGNRMCLCGIMAAERDDLPVEVRAEVDKFTELNIRWLGEVLALRTTKLPPKAVRRQALAIFAAIEGAQLIARGRNDIAIYDDAIEAYRAAGLL